MLSFAADENFNIHIINGVLRRFPAADIVRVQDAGLEGADDPAVLAWQPRKDAFCSLTMSTRSPLSHMNESHTAWQCRACLKSR